MKKDENFFVGSWMWKNCLQWLHPHPRSVALFGSFVRGDFHMGSDLDLLLVGDVIPKKPSERSRWVYPLVRAYGKALKNSEFRSSVPRSLSPLMLSESGWRESTGLRLSLVSECWILLDDGFLSSTLSETAGWIQAHLWNRQATRDGGWLWIPSSVEGASP